jgi:hypothetical protein
MKSTAIATAIPASTKCPSCHTVLPASPSVETEDYHCSRCGQRWDALRLSTTSAYTAWDAERSAGVTRRVAPALLLVLAACLTIVPLAWAARTSKDAEQALPMLNNTGVDAYLQRAPDSE